jgi:hypothetical protein
MVTLTHQVARSFPVAVAETAPGGLCWERLGIRQPGFLARSEPVSGVKLLPVATLAMLACTNGGMAPVPSAPVGDPFSYAAAACAPWDGPATTLLLLPEPWDSSGPAQPAGPFISVSIWKPVEALPGTTWDLSAEQNLGAATQCPKADACEPATAATVRFRSSGGNRLLEGELDLAFPTRGRVVGGCRAPWRMEPALCG